MKEIICAGFGGQGVLTCGLIISDIAVNNSNNATWVPSYGNAMRGGIANCTVKYGDGFVYNPSMGKADVVLAMNELSLNAYVDFAKDDAIIFVSEMVDISDFESGNKRVVSIPCYKIADEIGHTRGQNIIMTGAMLKVMGDFTLEQGIDSMTSMFDKKGKSKFNEINAMAMQRGFEFAQSVE